MLTPNTCFLLYLDFQMLVFHSNTITSWCHTSMVAQPSPYCNRLLNEPPSRRRCSFLPHDKKKKEKVDTNRSLWQEKDKIVSLGQKTKAVCLVPFVPYARHLLACLLDLRILAPWEKKRHSRLRRKGEYAKGLSTGREEIMGPASFRLCTRKPRYLGVRP